MKKRFFAALLSFIMIFSLLPTSVLAKQDKSHSTVVLHPSVGSTVTGVKVKVGGKIDGYSITSISGYDITVDLGKYNVNNDTFRLPYAKDIWEGVDNNKVDYISWAGSGSNRRSEGASALLANGKNTAYYYFKGAPVLLTFTLNYDANGGTGAPASQTYKATSEYEKSHNFTISSQKPTRDGYTFLGWNTNRSATTANYQPGGSIVVTGTTTLYAVWEEKAPVTPDDPKVGENFDFSKSIVDVICETTDTHNDSYGLMNGYYMVSDKKQLTNGNWQCKITVDLAKYFELYNSQHTGHTRDMQNKEATSIMEIYPTWYASSGKWILAETGIDAAKIFVKCDATPKEPSGEEVKNLLGDNAVRIICTNDESGHGNKTFGLIDGTFTVRYNGQYSCEVVINSFYEYVEEFNNELNVALDTHASDASKTDKNIINLKWSEGKWTVVDAPAKHYVLCVTEVTPPEKPADEDLAKLEAPVEVVCTTKPATHTAATFALIEGTYTIGDIAGNETDGYTCDINVTADEYVTRYNTDFGAHTLSGDSAKTLTLNYVEGKWAADGTVTFNVECEEELFPVNIVIYRNGDTSKAYKTVALESQPKGHVIDLTELKIADYYTANYTGKYDFCGWYNDGTWNVYKSDPANAPAGLEKITVNGWTNIIGMVYDYENVVYFRSAEDLSAYQNDHSKTEGLLYTTIARKGDALPTVDAPTAKRTGYTFKFWSREGQNGDVTGQTVGGWTNLYADWTPNSDTKYTVKYFFQNIADDQYTEDTELKEEPTGTTDTLATVTPRNFDGFTFNEGESTTNGTIAGDGSLVLALYYDRNAYTVTYTDGVDGKVFANDVHKDVKYEDATPAFNGTLTRTGYTFAGWDPEVADTVTGNVTYVAQWTADPIAVDLSQYVNKQYIRKYNRADTNATFTFEAEIASDALVVYAAAPRDLPVKLTGTVTLSTGETKNVAFTVNGTDSKTVSLNEGKYRITVKEVDSKNSYIDCDKSEYILYLDVYDDHTSGLTPVVTDISKNGELTCGDSVTFVNTYTRAYYSSVTTPSKPALNTGDHFAYVMGYPDGTVRPNGSITRAEVSTILFRLLSDKTRDEYFTTESSFTDVKAGAWYNNSIATLEKAGVIVDTAKGGAFRPDEAITRAELAAMLAQFADAKPVAGVKFTDVSADHWAYDAIAIAAKMGWIEGYPDGTFRPDATITRAEMMTLVNRALERVPSKEDHLLSERVMLTFPDCKSGDWFYIAVQEATNSHTYERAVTEKNGDEQWTALRANRDWTLLEK